MEPDVIPMIAYEDGVAVMEWLARAFGFYERVRMTGAGGRVAVDDLAEHYERAKLADATILSAPEEGPPGRRYRAEDLEGHRWMCMERKKA